MNPQEKVLVALFSVIIISSACEKENIHPLQNASESAKTFETTSNDSNQKEMMGIGIDDDLLDCNGNGVQDALDIGNGTSCDINLNGLPDECEVEVEDLGGPCED